VILEVANLVAVELVVLEDVAGGGKEKTTGAGGGINDGGSRLRAHDFNDGVDQDTGREVLAGAGLGILGVLFEQAFVDVALDVGAERAPGLLVDEIDDEAAQVGGVLDLVLGFAEDDAEDARLFAEIFEGVAVVSFERQAITFFDANIASGGDTEEEVVDNLRTLIIDTFDLLESVEPEKLGREPYRQLQLLRSLIRKI